MTSSMETEYKDWLMNMASKLVFPNGPYSQLFEHLYSVEFYSDVGNDSNRAADGLELRCAFIDENPQYNYHDACLYMPNKPCSMLEMMLALAIRCEHDIMHSDEYGDRTGIWFTTMLSNLGLLDQDDENYDSSYTGHVIQDFIDHNYKRNGIGGMFPIKGIRKDMKKAEIWIQMNWYLNSIIDQLE